MGRYEVALNKIPPLEYRLSQRLRRGKLMNALCETEYAPLMGDIDLFEKCEGTDLSFWYKCKSDEESNELGKMLKGIRNLEKAHRIIDKSFFEQMKRAAEPI